MDRKDCSHYLKADVFTVLVDAQHYDVHRQFLFMRQLTNPSLRISVQYSSFLFYLFSATHDYHGTRKLQETLALRPHSSFALSSKRQNGPQKKVLSKSYLWHTIPTCRPLQSKAYSSCSSSRDPALGRRFLLP